MTDSANQIDVYLEIGAKRTMAGAIDWPGWCRGGAGEDAALQALFDYASRYAHVLGTAPVGFTPPAHIAQFHVVQRIHGDSGTDYGVPAMAPAQDRLPVDEAELQRLSTLLQMCWTAFDAALALAAGKTLRKGPRGGGRDVEKMTRHVLEAEAGYAAHAGWKLSKLEDGDLRQQLAHTRQGVLDALAASAHGEVPAHGPRGGVHWPPRYFVRRVAWHVLDHAWELEDRIE